MTPLRLTVSEFNTIFADIVHHQLQLNKLCISGEITQFNYYNDKQHLYLTLSHNNDHLQCVVYNQHLKKIPVIHNGDHCEVIGQCKFLKHKGQLIFSAVAIGLDGTGDKKTTRTRQLSKFNKDGKFQLKTESDIPTILENVCIITSNQSAAHHDIMSILTKSPHTFESILIPSSVQGLVAPRELQQAITIAESLSPDLICISRGGGQDHDFDCFFDDSLANHICQSSIPIVTGIGHKINTTLCCLCANQHFETPTAMIQWVSDHSMHPIHQASITLDSIKHQIHQTIQNLTTTLTHIEDELHQSIEKNLALLIQKSMHLNDQIVTLNPIEKLTNGFVYCKTDAEKPLKTVQQIKKNDTIYLTLRNGKASATIKHVNQTTHS